VTYPESSRFEPGSTTPAFDGVADQLPRARPEHRRAVADGSVAFENAIGRDAVLTPRRATGGEVEEERLETVERSGEAGRLAGALLVLLPERAEHRLLVFGKEGEDPLRGEALALELLREGRFVGVDEDVAGIDLDDVVDEHHRDHAPEVDAVGRVFGEDEREHREVPRVLRAVLPSRRIGDVGAPFDELEAVDLEEEPELLVEAVDFPRARGSIGRSLTHVR
jgi:hypothetical protein